MFGIKAAGLVGVLAVAAAFASSAEAANIQITEWMYNGNGTGSAGEFVEFTNTSAAAIDMTGWSFDDNSRSPGSQSLSAFGTVQSGESVILTDESATAFRTDWGLSAPTKIIGGNMNNLGRADEINLYDNVNKLIDRLTYDDQTLGGPRTNAVSANITVAKLGLNAPASAVLSVAGDQFGSYADARGEIGNPGTYPAPVPLPPAAWLLISGLGIFGFVARPRSVASYSAVAAA